MRVVAGVARGRRLAVPAGSAVRPTSDRVREATFNALTSLGVIDDAVVVDLFAGSGALGIEALSRGAAHATFVDDQAAALAVVRSNLETTGLADRARVVRGDGMTWLAPADRPVDVALLDPPYTFDRWTELLASAQASIVVIESNRAVRIPDGWELLRDKSYGSTVVRVARRLPAARPSELP